MIRLRYGQIIIDGMKDNASIHWGNNFINGMVQHDKVSEAVGDIQGRENYTFAMKQLMIDSDVMDGGHMDPANED